MFRTSASLGLLSVVLSGTLAWADHPPYVSDDPSVEEHEHGVLLMRPDPDIPLMNLDSMSSDFVSTGPSSKIIKNVSVAARGNRLESNATTDVWHHKNYAYTGTFNSPCSTAAEDDAGVFVWDVNGIGNGADLVEVIDSPIGSRVNDVRVDTMNSGDILVHSNESCAGGPGGFEVYNVDDPENPVHLASVQTDDINDLLRTSFGYVDFGVHNLWLFKQGDMDYVAATTEGLFGNFQIFDITDPTAPALVGWWGAEQLLNPALADPAFSDFSAILDANTYMFEGYGASQNRFLHDVTITPDGQLAYLANWDAGLVLLDISDVTDPTLISVAIDPTSEDGEVNSHSVWPNEDNTIVVEGEEDFSPFETVFSISSGPAAGQYPATEGAITVSIASLVPPTMSGPTVYVGYACDADGFNVGFDDPVPAAPGAGYIALIQRGSCTFTSKIDNAEAAGYDGIVVMNDAARGDALVSMGGNPTNLPGVFVGHSTGLLIAGVAMTGDLVIGDMGESVNASTVPNGWSGLRIWDYTDPTNPILASTFNTVCSADPVDASCLPDGTYSSHNVVVETLGNQVLAYVSWYSDGLLVVDVTDPYNPVEIGRHTDQSPAFQAQNGGQQDIWGVHKVANDPFIYASDRNGGLYIYKLLGSGSLKKNKN